MNNILNATEFLEKNGLPIAKPTPTKAQADMINGGLPRAAAAFAKTYLPPIRLHATVIWEHLAGNRIDPLSGATLPIEPRTGGQHSIFRLLLVNIHTGQLVNRDGVKDGVAIFSSSPAYSYNGFLKPYERVACPPLDTIILTHDVDGEPFDEPRYAAQEAWKKHVTVDAAGNPKRPYPRGFIEDLQLKGHPALCYGVIEAIFDNDHSMREICKSYGGFCNTFDPLKQVEYNDGTIVRRAEIGAPG